MIDKLARGLVILLFAVPAFAEQPDSSGIVPALVIDVRTEDEYHQQHIRNAVNIPYDQIISRIATIASNRNNPIVLYCRSGRRAEIAKHALRQLGYTQIENKGGLDDMSRQGYQIN